MNAFRDKSSLAETSRPSNHAVTAGFARPAASPVDARPEIAAQQSLQRMADSSQQAAKMRQLKEMAESQAQPVQLLKKWGNNDDWQEAAWSSDILEILEDAIVANRVDILSYLRAGATYNLEVEGKWWQLEPEDLVRILPMTLDADRSPTPWAELNSPALAARKRTLIEKVKAVVDLAETMPVEFRAMMPHDYIFNRSPEAQLEHCVVECASSSVETLSAFLYTTYFYKPINNLLRGSNLGGHAEIISLVTEVVDILKGAAIAGGVGDINNRRVELQAEWIKQQTGDRTPKVGDILNFAAFTSVHAKADGVEKMKGDIGSGTFGASTEMAVLHFVGRSTKIVPGADKKYFLNEDEILLPPGTKVKIVGIKLVDMVNSDGEDIECPEYQLEILSADSTSSSSSTETM